VFDDVVDDVGGCVVDAAGLAHLGLLFDLGLMAGGEAYDAAEESFVDVSEDIGWEHGELVWAFGVVEAFDDGLEGLVVDGEVGGECIGGPVSAALFVEVEEPGVVAFVGAFGV